MKNVPVLTVDLTAIVANWRLLKARHGGKETAAVVKANAYGLGVQPVAQALANAGCTRFFVASLAEAIELRAALPDAMIYVFQGVLREEGAEYVHHRLKPVLNTPSQLDAWKRICAEHSDAQAAAIHVDTGMQRLGLTPTEIRRADVLEKARGARADFIAGSWLCRQRCVKLAARYLHVGEAEIRVGQQPAQA